mmetsp:Transcript_115625/g.327695  ORF Transcript_115625/g.327695 Transcript_115625/m.327695 type:complete len:229 (-) Transcript_115625:23-709(-)
MIPTSVKPASSSAARMAPTRPSIMSLGLTKSAPASACETACLQSWCTVSSFMTTPSERTMPSWPSELYGSNATSVNTTTSGKARFKLRMARCARPLGLKHSSAVGVFRLSGVFGKITTDFTPSFRALSTSRRSPVSTPRRETPGIEEIGTSSAPSCTNTGRIRFAGVSTVSDTIRRRAGLRRFLRGRLRMPRWPTSGTPSGSRGGGGTVLTAGAVGCAAAQVRHWHLA